MIILLIVVNRYDLLYDYIIETIIQVFIQHVCIIMYIWHIKEQ